MMKNVYVLVLFSFLLIFCNVFKCKKKDVIFKLKGIWEFIYIIGLKIVFEGLYLNKKFNINFNIKENVVFGNNSCNFYIGKFEVKENKIDFIGFMVLIKMMCLDGQGEKVFMNILLKVIFYIIFDDGKILNFILGDIEIMCFNKK